MFLGKASERPLPAPKEAAKVHFFSRLGVGGIEGEGCGGVDVAERDCFGGVGAFVVSKEVMAANCCVGMWEESGRVGGWGFMLCCGRITDSMNWEDERAGDSIEGDVIGVDVMWGDETEGAVVRGGMRNRADMMAAAAAATEVKRRSYKVAFFFELDKLRLILSQSLFSTGMVWCSNFWRNRLPKGSNSLFSFISI